MIVALLVWVTMSAPEPMGLCGSRVLLPSVCPTCTTWPPVPPGGVRLFLILSLFYGHWGMSLSLNASLCARARVCVCICVRVLL